MRTYLKGCKTAKFNPNRKKPKYPKFKASTGAKMANNRSDFHPFPTYADHDRAIFARLGISSDFVFES